jgi:hypothetical protein
LRKGKVISLALNFDHTGRKGAKAITLPWGGQSVHTMIRTGTDATQRVDSAASGGR